MCITRGSRFNCGVVPPVILVSMMAVAVTVAQPPAGFDLGGGSGRSGYNASHPNDFTLYNQDETKRIDPAHIKYVSAPMDAVAYALADSTTVPALDQPFQRYIWIPDGDPAAVMAVKFSINVVSRASTLIKPAVVAQGRLVRVDLRQLAPRADENSKDFREIFQLWEKYAFEPYFHVVRSSDDALPTNIKLLPSDPGDPIGSKLFEYEGQRWYMAPNGKCYCWVNNAWQLRKLFTNKINIAAAGVHVGLDQHVMLQGTTQSNAPIVRYDWWLVKTLTTVDGGFYYDWLGVERNPKNVTAQTAFLAKFGADAETVAKLRGDQRAALFRSRVTGKPRQIEVFRSQGVRPDSGTGLVTITHDPNDADVDANTDPIRNLLVFKDTAREVIVERQNGMHAFALFNNKGALQDSAPDNVVKDHTILPPYTARLEPAIGCIRCHGPFDGWQPFQNEVKLLLSNGSYGGLNAFDDLSDQFGDSKSVVDRLAGLYAGELTKALRRGRDDYSDSVFVVTGGQSVPKASGAVAEVFRQYRYTEVDAVTACRELGYEVPRERAALYLNLIIPPLSRDITGISPEDPIAGALKAGLSVQRAQWESIYADMAFRALQSRKEWDQQKRK